MQTILTGVRINEEPTIGNFLGAYAPMVRSARKHAGDYEINMFIPDLHSFTTPVDHASLHQQTLKAVKYYLAAGLDSNNPHIHFYRNSHVPAHAELCWILDCFTYFGEAQRMTQFKEKSAKLKDNAVTIGLFNYPVLMTADILLYDSKYVPLGEDQFQHLELCRDIASRFNRKFKQDIFTIPVAESAQIKFMELGEGLRIRSLTDPSKKMSKSSNVDKSKINLSDPPATAVSKIMSATTDSVGVIQFDMFNQPGISNLLQIEALINDLPLQDVISTWAGETHYGDLKQKVASSVSEFLEDFQSKVANISDVDAEAVLEQGEIYANQVANAKLHAVQRLIGLRP